MARLIDADALLNDMDLDAMTEADGYKMDLMRSDIKAAIDDAATVDAVEVVRCWDCGRKKHERDGIWCNFFGCFMHPDDFCSRGFKR